MLKIAKDFTKTFIEQVVDTWCTLDTRFQCSQFGQWCSRVDEFKKYVARASFWYILGITSMLAE